MRMLIFVIGIITNLGLFGIYFYLYLQNTPIDEMRTFMFTALGLDSLIYVFSIRSFRKSIFQVNPFQNRFLVLGVLIGFMFLLIPLMTPFVRNLFEFVPLKFSQILVLVFLGIVKILLIEVVKFAFNYGRRKQTRAVLAL